MAAGVSPARAKANAWRSARGEAADPARHWRVLASLWRSITRRHGKPDLSLRTTEPWARDLFLGHIMPMGRKIIAIIDDDLDLLAAVERLLSSLGYGTESYASA